LDARQGFNMTKNALLESLGIEYPILLAPMGGGPGTPELAAAVSEAGGLGSLGAAYMTPAQMRDAIRKTRTLTRKPFHMNLFAGGIEPRMSFDARPMLALLTDVHQTLELPPPVLPTMPADPFPAQLEVVLEERPTVFSFTFGIPSVEALRRLKERGIVVLGTATTVREGQLLEQAGVDAIVAQGAEAGAHRGTFAGPFETSIVPLQELVCGMLHECSLPVIASGGIMDGRDIAAALANGAAAVQLGTAFLACPESGASEAYKRAILAARRDTTVITRAFSGRPARGLTNTFISQLEGREEIILPFPMQNALTRPMRAAAAERGDPEFLSLWAGQGVARARSLPASQLVRRLVEETRNAQQLAARG
jgi:nitronate monooxygenase